MQLNTHVDMRVQYMQHCAMRNTDASTLAH